MNTKCSYDHEKVCTNIIQLKKCKINNRFFLGIFFNNKISRFYHILRQNRQ